MTSRNEEKNSLHLLCFSFCFSRHLILRLHSILLIGDENVKEDTIRILSRSKERHEHTIPISIVITFDMIILYFSAREYEGILIIDFSLGNLKMKFFRWCQKNKIHWKGTSSCGISFSDLMLIGRLNDRTKQENFWQSRHLPAAIRSRLQIEIWTDVICIHHHFTHWKFHCNEIIIKRWNCFHFDCVNVFFHQHFQSSIFKIASLAFSHFCKILYLSVKWVKTPFQCFPNNHTKHTNW